MRRFSFLLLATAGVAAAQADPFAALDADRDGKLSKQELPEPLRPHFERIDADGDGFITRAEQERALPSAGKPAAYDLRKDIDYVGKGNPRETLDVLVPKDAADKKRPLVVFIHGGGWVAGRKEDGLDVVKALAGTGDYVTATINYRLSSEAPWPAQIHDCKAAIRFLRGNAEQYGIDPERIGVMGLSAGGHLVSLLGTVNAEPSLEGALGAFTRISSRVQCVVNFFGPTDFLINCGKNAKGAEAEGAKMVAQLLDAKSPGLDERIKAASPVTWVSKDDAPFFIAHGTKDELVPIVQAHRLDDALKQAGVESHLVEMVGGGHGFFSDELNERIRRFLDQHLRGMKMAISDAPIELKK